MIKLTGIVFMSAILFSSCSSDYLDTAPTSSVSTESIFADLKTAEMAINGIARLMVSQYSYYGQVFCGEGTIKFLSGEYMGEHFSRPALSGWSTVMNGNHIDNNGSIYNSYPWYYYYMLIGNANEFIGNIDRTPGSESKRKFLKAQAYVYRAFCYTQLVQFYCKRWVDSNGGTSLTNRADGLVLRTEDNRNVKDVALKSSGEIYAQIYSDLDQAITLFNESGVSRNKVWEPNINVAYAVYARAAITKQDYPKAADMAAKARAGYSLMDAAQYKSGFSSPNDEWIWGSYGGADQTLYYYGFHSYMAYDANASIVRSYPVCMSKTLYDKIPATDIRRDLFLDPLTNNYSQTDGTVTPAFATTVRAAHPTMLPTHVVAAYMSFKFSINGSVGVGYINQFRSSEMYLIEAEANYFQGKITEAQNLMNTLVKDSGRDAAYTCDAIGADLLSEIKFYRAIELWGEGFDWLDKKRYNEPIVRKSFAEGGNFYPTMAITMEVDYKNRWTYVTPLIEDETNEAI